MPAFEGVCSGKIIPSKGGKSRSCMLSSLYWMDMSSPTQQSYVASCCGVEKVQHRMCVPSQIREMSPR